jgi:hypothetical protein
MTDFDLKSKLRSVPVPERPPEYWEDFPARLRANLRRPPAAFAGRPAGLPRLVWNTGFALACVMFSLAGWPAFHAALQNEKVFRRELAQFPGHLRVLMQSEHGMHYLIADQP